MKSKIIARSTSEISHSDLEIAKFDQVVEVLLRQST